MFELSTKETSIPSVERVLSILTENTEKIGIPVDYDRILEYQALYTIKADTLLKRIIKYTNCNVSACDYKDSHFLAFLKSANATGGLLATAKGNYSLSAESLNAAIATKRHSKEICTLMGMYSEAKSSLTKVSPFKKIIQEYRPCGVLTWDNHRMLILKPTWAAQNTNRVGARTPAVMNISKELGDIFTVPKGWIYFEADSGQIEPRIIQSFIIRDPILKRCTMAYDDAYFGYLHYCKYLSDAERANPNTVITPVELTDEQKERRKKFKTFGNAVMYGSTENNENDLDKDAFIRYIGGHPNRIALQGDIEERINRGQRIFNTAFGTPIDITKGPSELNYEDKTSNAYIAHLVRCAINNPIQGTAADLMRYSVVKANNLLLRKAPSSCILQYVHDAGKFMIHEDDYDNVINELREITAYQVDDWLPVYCEPVEGIHESNVKRFIA